jgi:hypothetical protein
VAARWHSVTLARHTALALGRRRTSLLFCVALPVAAIHVLLGGAGLESTRVDDVLTAINLAACTAYVYFATGAVYAAAGAARFLKAALLTIAVGAIVLGYRFLIFLITLYVI